MECLKNWILAEIYVQSFEEIGTFHEELDGFLLKHQEALILMRPEAPALFQTFRAMLQLHIEHEDNILLPLFERDQEAQRWPTMLYFKEHRKLEDFLQRIETAQFKLGIPCPSKVRAVIELIDLEGGLKRLLEHHDIRERKDFFPLLDKVTQSQERIDVLTRLNQEWNALKVAQGLTV